MHRFDFDGRYAYISPTAEGYIGNIAMILDLADPAKPVEVGRWWIPGQWEAGGEQYPWGDWVAPRCHHPLRFGDRLYVSYWHHGLFILDIADLSRPKPISHVNTSPAFPHPTHTCLAFRRSCKGRDIMVVADEDVAKLWPSPPSFTWIYDITNERTPIPIATFQVPGLDTDGSPQPPMTGCHQPSERFRGTVIPFAWFAQGLRLVDFADPFSPKRSVIICRSRPPGADRASSNDVTIDERGLIYLVDRIRGVDIIETSVIQMRAEHGRCQQAERKDVYSIGKKNPNLPFHPAVRAGDFIFVSGQVAKDADGNMVPGTIEEETAARSKRSGASLPKKARRSPTSCG